jgi:hypothetical protein
MTRAALFDSYRMMNSALVDVSEVLDQIWCSPDPKQYIEEHMALIHHVLDYSSDVLSMVPDKIKKHKTWKYDMGEEECGNDLGIP